MDWEIKLFPPSVLQSQNMPVYTTFHFCFINLIKLDRDIPLGKVSVEFDNGQCRSLNMHVQTTISGISS